MERMKEHQTFIHEDQNPTKMKHKDLDQGPSTSRKMVKLKSKNSNDIPTLCLICGAPTDTLHYDVASCNSCKTFFRRCVVLSVFFKCKKDKNCNLDHNNQPYNPCKGCRLGRCLAIGMNPEAIQYPKSFDVKACLEKFYDFKNEILPLYMDPKLTSPHDAIHHEILSLLYVENKFRKIRESTYHPGDLLLTSIQDILVRPSELCHADKYEKPHEWPYPIEIIYEQIIEMLKEIAMSGKILFLHIRKFWMAIDNVLIIETSKALPFFRLLDLADQAIVLRHVSLVNTLLTQSFYSFLNNHSTIVMPDGTIPYKIRSELVKVVQEPEITENNPPLLNYYKKVMTFIQQSGNQKIIDIFQRIKDNFPILPDNILEQLFNKIIDPLRRVNLSEKEYVLLKSLVYSYYALPELSDYARSILRQQAEKFSQLLLKYLQIEHGDMIGAAKYAEVIGLMNTFFKVAEKHRQTFFLHQISRSPQEPSDIIFQHPKLLEEIMHVQ